jgi:TPR repeat protein
MAALRLYLLAAGNGNAKAAINLAKMFHGGVALKPDHLLAYMWLRVAAHWGENLGGALRSEEESLSKEEILRANEKAASWLAQHRLGSGSSSLTSSLARVE